MSPPPVDRRRLGELALENGLLGATALRRLLSLQKALARLDHRVPIGQILVERGLLDRATLYALLVAQAERRGADVSRIEAGFERYAIPAAADPRLERVLERGGHVRPAELARCRKIRALLEKHGIDKGLPEILLERGVVAPDLLDEIRCAFEGTAGGQGVEFESGLHARVGPGGDAARQQDWDDDLRFGRLVQTRRLATAAEVEEAVVLQILLRELGVGRRIGELLVDRGHLQPGDVERVLREQADLLAEVRWADHLEGDPADPIDETAAWLLESEGLLTAERVLEARYVQQTMFGFGIERDLLGAVKDLGWLEPRTIRELREQLADAMGETRAPPAPGRRGSRPLSTESDSASPDDPLRLGRLAVFNGLVDEEAVADGLAIQESIAAGGFPMPLGAILVARRALCRKDLEALLKAQARGRGLDPEAVDVSADLVKFTPDEHDRLLARIEADDLVGPEEAAEAIALQRMLDEHGIAKDLGEVYLARGVLGREVVHEVLQRRLEIRRRLEPRTIVPSEVADPLEELLGAEEGYAGLRRRLDVDGLNRMRRYRLGRLAIQQGALTPEVVREGLAIQMRLRELGAGWPLGRILVERGHLRPGVLGRLLDTQRASRERVGAGAGISSESILTAAEMRLARFLLERSILTPDQVSECARIKGVLIDLELDVPLARILADKEFIDEELVETIARQAEESAGPGTGVDRKAFRRAYQDILEVAQARRREEETLSRRRSVLSAMGVDRRRAAGRRWWSVRPPIGVKTVAGAAVLAGVALVLAAGPSLLRARPRDEPLAGPRDVLRPALDGPTPMTVEGTVVRFGSYPASDGRSVSFDLILAAGDGFLVVRGTAPVEDPIVADLAAHEGTGRRLVVTGVLHPNESGPLVLLPDRNRTRAYLELETYQPGE